MKGLWYGALIGLFLVSNAQAHSARMLTFYTPEQGLKQRATKIPVRYQLQLSSFRSKKNAVQFLQHMKLIRPPIPVHIVPTHGYYRVLVGPLTNIKTLHHLCQQLQHQATLTRHKKPYHGSRARLVKRVPHVPSIKFVPKTMKPVPMRQTASPLDLSLAIGPQWLHAKTGYMNVTTTDQNADVISHASTNALYSIGLGYHPFQNQLSTRHYLNDFVAQLNYYYTTGNITGQAWDYLSSNCNNQFFTAPVHSSRLALDFKPQLLTYKSLSPYVIAGIGAAWNKLSYVETPNGDYAESSIHLGTHTNQNVMYDLGVGVSAQWHPHVAVSIEYLYTSLCNVAPSNQSQTAQSVVSPPSFALATNALLARVTWKFNDQHLR